MGCSPDADANPRNWLDSLLSIGRADELFTGIVTTAQQHRKRSGCRMAPKKLTIGSENIVKSITYNIA
jgi:hypothetical protein